MALKALDGTNLPAAADFHVHLRDGAMMELVVPTIRQGGVNIVYVMPNLIPPITTVKRALEYKDQLESLEPKVTFLMSLYLHESITPETIIEAKNHGITGVKSYPAGVTTNSSAGVVDYTQFHPVFAEMERQGLILNIHGEAPSKGDITVLNAEERFLPTFVELTDRFPKLRIILEHLTTKAAVDTISNCGPNVVGTITAHHLSLIVDSWAGDPFCFCKPVAKTPADRDALLQAVASRNPKFFFGSDSAPHPVEAKRGSDKFAAGVFTQPYATQLVIDALEQACERGVLRAENVDKSTLEGFLCQFGRQFYGVEDTKKKTITLHKRGENIKSILRSESSKVEVVPFRREQETWSVTWS
ncbi:MAG: hypothetical protein M1820_001683 [Bogoriella megaspora]|nr:MAG: hypothetical protein M1820_001683 [Bogoriella megaspora]